jgi:hypothetical protein
MASFQECIGTYRVIFRSHGRQHFVVVGKVSPKEAEAKAARVDYLLMRLGSWDEIGVGSTLGRRHRR